MKTGSDPENDKTSITEGWKPLHDFWFGKVLSQPATLPERLKLWFFRDLQMDMLARENFETWLKEWQARGAAWSCSAWSRLSLILLLDQIPRNIYRGQAEAFAWDAEALNVAAEVIAEEALEVLHPLEQVFLFLPFQHSENLEHQEISLRHFQRLADEAPAALRDFLKVAKKKAEQHHEAIRRFGRFPHRNAICGRTSTAQELDFLNNPEAWF